MLKIMNNKEEEHPQIPYSQEAQELAPAGPKPTKPQTLERSLKEVFCCLFKERQEMGLWAQRIMPEHSSTKSHLRGTA